VRVLIAEKNLWMSPLAVPVPVRLATSAPPLGKATGRDPPAGAEWLWSLFLVHPGPAFNRPTAPLARAMRRELAHRRRRSRLLSFSILRREGFMAQRSSAPRDLEPGFLSPIVLVSSIVGWFVVAPTIFTLLAA
jgi:hypothetical protein